jgi:4-amino-4-deoxy-L-arabinose transferase-like glycosyltransferase
MLETLGDSKLVQPIAAALLPLILLAALLLRLYQVDQPYTDLAGWRQTSVAMMADNYYHRNPNILYPEVSWNGPGLSYNGREFQTVSYIASLLYRVVGQHDWVGRLVAVAFGVWGVFALYRLVQRLWGERHALTAAGVMAALPAAVYFDRSFLPDPAMVALITSSHWMLIAYLQSGRSHYLVLTAVLACWGFLSKITGMITLLPMLYAVIAILHERKQLTATKVVKVVAPGLAVVGVVAAYYLWARHLSLSYPPYHFAGEANWLWNDGLRSWVQQRFFLPDLAYIFKNWTLGLPFIGLFIAGVVISAVSIRRRMRAGEITHYNGPYLFHFWLAGCLVFYVMGAKELVWNFWNFHIWSPMIAAFCGATLVAARQRLARRPVLALTVGLLLAAWIVVAGREVLRNTFTDEYYISDYRMGLRLRNLRQPDDLVIVLAREVGNPIAIFYSGGRGWVFPPAGKDAWDRLPTTAAQSVATLEQLREQGADWFAIQRGQYQTIQQSYPLFASYLTSRYAVRADEPDFVIFQL